MKNITKQNTNNRCFIYARVASTRITVEDKSLQYQIESCKNYALKNCYGVEGIFTEIGISGNATKKPQLSKMLNKCKAQKINKVIVYSIDRLARNSISYLLLKQMLKKYGIKLYSATQEIRNENSPESELVDSILMSLNAFGMRFH